MEVNAAKRKAVSESTEAPDNQEPKKKIKKGHQTFEEKVSAECLEVTCTGRLSRSVVGSTNLALCIVCQEGKRDSRNRRVEEKLSQCVTYEAEYSLLEAAKIRGHTRVIRELDGEDAIAKEVKYHRTCFTLYVNKKSLRKIAEGAVEDDLASGNSDAKEIAFSKLVQHLEESVLADTSSVTDMTQICTLYNGYLADQGVEASHRSFTVKQRLVTHFEDRLQFHRPASRREPEFVYSSLASAGAFIEQYKKSVAVHAQDIESIEAESELHALLGSAQDSSQSHLYGAACELHHVVHSVRNKLSTPPQASELSAEIAEDFVPDILYNFLAAVIDAKTLDNGLTLHSCKTLVSSDRVHRRILAIAQDIVFAASGGAVKPPKHVSLSLAVKTLTGSAKLVKVLNGFGHSIGESQTREVETEMAARLLKEQEDNVFIPSVIHYPSAARVSVAFDNMDINEETLTGADTTHVTNGIAVQRRVQWCAPPPSQHRHEEQPKHRRRSLAAPAYLPVEYNAGPRCNPMPLDVSEEALQPNYAVLKPGRSRVLLWSLSRLAYSHDAIYGRHANSEQAIPGWSGFCSLWQTKQENRPSNVGYLPVIPASPTELSTIYTILQRINAIASCLKQQDIIAVFDQAIYAKVLEVQWKHTDEFQDIVPRMGAFHISCTFLAVLGSGFVMQGCMISLSSLVWSDRVL